MQGQAQPLYKFFDGWDTRLIIPVYQRNYDWKEANCDQLFDDLLTLHRNDRRSHFFGSIVSQVDSGTLRATSSMANSASPPFPSSSWPWLTHTRKGNLMPKHQ